MTSPIGSVWVEVSDDDSLERRTQTPEGWVVETWVRRGNAVLRLVTAPEAWLAINAANGPQSSRPDDVIKVVGE